MGTKVRLSARQQAALEDGIQQTNEGRRSVAEMVRSRLCPLAIDTAEKVRLRLDILGVAEPARRPRLERIMGPKNFAPASMRKHAASVARSAAPVRICEAGSGVGYGTGFMVSPVLLVTNNHVLPTRELALESRAEFSYQDKRRDLVR